MEFNEQCPLSVTRKLLGAKLLFKRLSSCLSTPIYFIIIFFSITSSLTVSSSIEVPGVRLNKNIIIDRVSYNHHIIYRKISREIKRRNLYSFIPLMRLYKQKAKKSVSRSFFAPFYVTNLLLSYSFRLLSR